MFQLLFLLRQDGTKRLTTGSKILVCHNYKNFLNMFRLLFLLPSSRWYKRLNYRLQNPCLWYLQQFSKYLFRLLLLLPSSRWYKGFNYRLQNPCLPLLQQFSKCLFRVLFLLHSSRWYKGLKYRLQNPCLHYYNNFLNTCFDYIFISFFKMVQRA